MSDDLLTIRDFLRYGVSAFRKAGLVHGHGATNALDEAAYLILETLHLPLDQLDPFLDARLLSDERAAVRAVLDRRVATRKPAAYLTNRAYIQGRSFYVDERVIVPRSYLGELLLSDLIGGEGLSIVEDPDAVSSVLDLCTGSGCLAILAAEVFASASVDAVDLSADALAVAAINVADYGLQDRVNLHEGDLFAPLKGRRFDLILSNPPYVDADGMTDLPPEYAAEPAMALDGGPDGLDLVRRIVAQAPDHLTENGGLLVELGRCRPAFETAFPDLDVLWLDSAESEGEVFFVTRAQLTSAKPKRRR